MTNGIPYRNVSGNATAQLASLGYTNFRGGDINNKSTTDVWLHLYDAAAALDVTVGTTTPKQSFMCPFSDGTNYVTREVIPVEDGLKFDLGLVWAITREPDGGATAPAANCLVNFRIS